MAKLYTAKEVTSRLRAEIDAGRPLFAPNCGFGLSAKLQEMGGRFNYRLRDELLADEGARISRCTHAEQ